MNHTGAIIRFTTSQLPHLPTTKATCSIALPHGGLVIGRFNPKRANPNITGAELRHWIKATVPESDSLRVVVAETAAGHLTIMPTGSGPGNRGLAPEVAALAELPEDRRQEEYERWERSANLRREILSVWPHACQVTGCLTLNAFAEQDRAAALEVHHVEHVGNGGTDGIMNLCLICANHHRLIHLGQPSAVVGSCDATEVRIQIGSVDLVSPREEHRPEKHLAVATRCELRSAAHDRSHCLLAHL